MRKEIDWSPYKIDWSSYKETDWSSYKEIDWSSYKAQHPYGLGRKKCSFHLCENEI